MQAYTWYIPDDEIEEYYKMQFRLENIKIPLYFLPRTELVDSINITDPFKKSTKIGYTTVNFIGPKVNHVFYINDNTDMGNMAIELTDQIIDSNLTKEQLYIVPTFYAVELRALLSLKMGVLGPVQEDYFSAYFTGKTIRPYGYMKKDYSKNTYTDDESNFENKLICKKFSVKGLYEKIYQIKCNRKKKD